MKASIVLLNYKSEKLVLNFYENFIASQLIHDFCLIIVDNSPGFFKKIVWHKSTHYLKSQSNVGYAKGNNIGLKKSYELGLKYSFIFNPDLKINNLIQIRKTFNDLVNHKCNFGVAYLKIKHQRVYYRRPDIIEIAFPFLKLIFSKNKFFSDKKNIYHGSGACMFLNLDIINKVNYFDERTFLFFEEAILAEKLRKIKIRSIFYDKYQYTHLHSYSINKDFKKTKYDFMSSSLILYLNKYRSISNFLSKIISKLNLTYIKIVHKLKWIIK